MRFERHFNNTVIDMLKPVPWIYSHCVKPLCCCWLIWAIQNDAKTLK